MADINGNAVNKTEKLTIDEIVDRLEGLRSSLDTIRRAASDLITGIDAQLQELRSEGELSDFYKIQAEPVNSSADKEEQLLHGSPDRYGIYQLKDNPELDQYRFENMASLEKRGLTRSNFEVAVPENYELVYVGELSELPECSGQPQAETLETLYEKFNVNPPADYKGHSLSVSDIVVLHEDGKNSAHFVDSVGFTGLPDFARALEGVKEQVTEKAETGLTDREKQFLEKDSAPLIAKAFFAWDEIEDLGYRFFEDGYIDKFRPSEKSLYGGGMVSEPVIYDVARRMHNGEDIREELAKILVGSCKQITDDNNVVVVFGAEDVAVTFGNAEKQISYEELGTAFLALFEKEYREIAQARIAEAREKETDTSEQNEQKAEMETEQDSIGQSVQKAGQPEIDTLGQSEQKAGQPGTDTLGQNAQKLEMEPEQDTIGQSVQKLETKEFEDGDEIIDLGDETEQVLAELRNTLGQTDQNSEILHGDVVENFKAETDKYFHAISDMNASEIEDTVKFHVQAKIDEYSIDAVVVDAAVVGSRCRALEKYDSDLDVVVELSTEEQEDRLFNAFNNDGLRIGGVKVDINPITAQRTGTLESYLPQVEEYLSGVQKAREQEPKSIFAIYMYDEKRYYENISGLDGEAMCKAYAECKRPFVEMAKYGKPISEADFAYIQQGEKLSFSIEFDAVKDEIVVSDGEHFMYKGLTETIFSQEAEPETEITLTVAECGEFHSLGEFHENIPTVEEAIAIWKQISPERMNGIPAIGINIHTPGTAEYEDVVTDILVGNRFELDVLEYIPEIRENPQAMEIIAELMEKMPDMKIEGDVSHLTMRYANALAEKTEQKQAKRSEDLPEKLSVCDISAKTSLKVRLAEKKAQVTSQGNDENTKNKQREM